MRYQTAPRPVARQCREERATGIEPALGAWKAPVQPQHFARKAPAKRTEGAWVRAGQAGLPTDVACVSVDSAGARRVVSRPCLSAVTRRAAPIWGRPGRSSGG